MPQKQIKKSQGVIKDLQKRKNAPHPAKNPLKSVERKVRAGKKIYSTKHIEQLTAGVASAFNQTIKSVKSTSSALKRN